MKKTKEFTVMFLAMLLSILMAVYLFPADVAATYATGGPDPEDPVNEQTEEALDALYELTELRTADTKYIKMSDGTIQALVYDAAIHAQDENGVWQEIDNRLTESQNTIGSARVKFNKKITGNGELFTMHDGNKKITLSLSGAVKKTPITVTNDGMAEKEYATKLEELSTLSQTVSSVRYNGILPNTDIEYILSGNDLKENLVINGNSENYIYTFELALNNLTAALAGDGSVVLSDGQDVVYTMPAPYMYDAEGVSSDAVVYALTEANGNGEYTLTIIADTEWINDTNRVFPVTIDPTITVSSNNVANISASSDGNTSSYYMNAGVGTNVTHRSFFSFILPTLPDGSIVTSAIFKPHQFEYLNITENAAYIAARRITSLWNASALSWGNQPDVDNTVIDYALVSASTNAGRLSFDITSIYKKWVSGDYSNYGVMISALDENNCGGFAQLGSTSFPSSQRPILEVNFRNIRGIEDRFTYQVMDVGNAGTLYICDNSFARTIIKNLTYSCAGSIDLVYNSIGSSSYPTPANTLQIAKGWSLSCTQTVSLSTFSYEYAVLVDEDGTSHYYYYRSNNGFVDEDDSDSAIYFVGLNVSSVDLSEFAHDSTSYASLQSDYGTYLLVKSSGDKVLFYNGIAVAAVDTFGNITEYHYNEASVGESMSLPTTSAKVLTSVYDFEKTDNEDEYEAHCRATFAKSGNNTIITIDEDVYTVSVNLSGNLVSISKGNEVIATYAYNNHYITDLHDNEIGYGIAFSGTQRTEVYEYFDTNTGNVTGRKLYLYGGKGFSSTYVDHRSSTSEGLTISYLFDKTGRTVCTYTSDLDYNVYSAANIAYDDAIGSSNSRNAIYSASGLLPWNLLPNSGAEDFGTFENVTFSPMKMRSGVFSIALSTDSNAPYVTVNLTAGQAYTFSAYVNLETATVLSANGGAYLQVSCNEVTEVFTSYKLFTQTESDDEWQRIYLTFTPSITGSYTLYLKRSGISGTIYFDDLQLETGAALGEYSYVSNGAFTSSTCWERSNNSAVSYSKTNFRDANWPCVKIVGSPDAQRYAKQTINIYDTGKSFTLSGWAKADSVALKDDRTFELRAVILYDDDSTETVSIPFTAEQAGEWQFVSGNIVTKANNGENDDNMAITIDVYVSYDYNYGDAYFTGISLVENDMYVWAADGEEEESNTGSNDPEDPEDPETVTLSEMLSCINIGTEYFSEHYLSTESITGDIECYTEYDADSGIYTKTFVNDLFYIVKQYKNSASMEQLWYTLTLSIYDSNGNLVLTEDTLGGLTRYTYTDGVMTAETSPRGTVTEYTYSEEQLISASVVNKAQVLYNYTGSRLTGVTAGLNDTHGTQGYTFEYNAYGRLSAVKAGNYTLVSYTYDNDGINITSVTYANGLVIGYRYDILDRVTEIKYNNVTKYKYAYTGEGALLFVEDAENNTKKVYLDSGKVTSVLTVNTQTGKVIAATYTTVNDEGQTIAVKECFYVGSEWKEETTAYTYNEDGDLTSVSAGGVTQNYSYDALKRLTGIAGTGFTKSFGYRTENGRTCDLVGTLSYDRANGTNLLSLSYEYDAAGNITKVKKGDVVYNQYAYDELGQLTREDNRDANKSFTYSYDSRGNVLEKKTYAFTLNTLGTEQSTVTYGYATDSWKDRLTSYNGYTITYDNGGNPVTYNNGSAYAFTWEGRQMQTATKGNTTWSYTYNADGLRTSKSNGSAVYTYTWNENRQLQSMTWDYGYAIFSYDANGLPYSVKNYDAVLDVERTYLYVTNLQGDVLFIIDETTGQTAVSYTYDAWGKLLSKTSTSSDYASIYEYNPLTYRGYIYDSETGFYYLQSRYYDPSVGRFLNADDIMFLGSDNTINCWDLFTYCANNSINSIDKYGFIAGVDDCIAIIMAVCTALLTIGLVAGLICWAVTRNSAIQNSNTLSYDRLAENFRNRIRVAGTLLMVVVAGIQVVLSKLDNIIRDALAASFARASTPSTPRSDEIHHIVARTDRRAIPAATILRKLFKDGTEIEENLIKIKYGLHRRLHTNVYYAFVNAAIKGAVDSTNSISQKKDMVKSALILLKEFIRALNKTAPF